MKIRIVIGYDGSDGADAALDDLPKAGLGNDVDALVLSVAELWLPPPPPSAVDESFPLYTPPGLKTAREHVAHVMNEVGSLNKKAVEHLRANFPTWEVRVAEFGGGIALILGLLTPLGAFGLICQMIGALVLVHLPQGHAFVSQSGPSYELPLIYLVIAVLLIGLGPGKWSLDAVLFGKRGLSALEPTKPLGGKNAK